MRSIWEKNVLVGVVGDKGQVPGGGDPLPTD